VISFVEKESLAERKLNADVVEENDWICFDSTLINKDGQLLESGDSSDFWMHVKKTGSS